MFAIPLNIPVLAGYRAEFSEITSVTFERAE